MSKRVRNYFMIVIAIIIYIIVVYFIYKKTDSMIGDIDVKKETITIDTSIIDDMNYTTHDNIKKDNGKSGIIDDKKNDALIVNNNEDKNDVKINDKSKNESSEDVFYFAGDIYMSRHVKGAYDIGGIDGIMDVNYRDMLKNSRVRVANFESAITDELTGMEDKQFSFSMPTKYVKVLKEIGFNVYNLANNHILDFGLDALYNTMNTIKKLGYNYIGVGNNAKEAASPYTIDLNGRKYAIFSASAVVPDDSWKATDDLPGVSNGYNYFTVCRNIQNYKKDGYKCFVYVHWGVELSESASDSQKTFAYDLVKAGADLVVGSHPHVLQEIEYYKGVPIVYSLGNFIFGSTKKDTMLLEVKVDYSKDEKGKVKLIVHPGTTFYEMVNAITSKREIAAWCKKFSSKCKKCYISDEGLIYTEEDIKKRATISEIVHIEETLESRAKVIGPGVNLE